MTRDVVATGPRLISGREALREQGASPMPERGRLEPSGKQWHSMRFRRQWPGMRRWRAGAVPLWHGCGDRLTPRPTGALVILDLRIPAVPVVVGAVSTGSPAVTRGVEVQGGVCVSGEPGGRRARRDVSTPAAPRIVSAKDFPTPVWTSRSRAPSSRRHLRWRAVRSCRARPALRRAPAVPFDRSPRRS